MLPIWTAQSRKSKAPGSGLYSTHERACNMFHRTYRWVRSRRPRKAFLEMVSILFPSMNLKRRAVAFKWIFLDLVSLKNDIQNKIWKHAWIWNIRLWGLGQPQRLPSRSWVCVQECVHTSVRLALLPEAAWKASHSELATWVKTSWGKWGEKKKERKKALYKGKKVLNLCKTGMLPEIFPTPTCLHFTVPGY